MKGLEVIKAHYTHPYHDHNWAYYINEQTKKALADIEKMEKEK